MTEAPSRSMLLELGHDLGWPPVTIGRLTFLGIDEWRTAVARTTPIERRAWLQGLAGPLLNATPHSRARMDAWLRSPVRLPVTPEWMRENIVFYGDASMLDPVVAAVGHTPAPVREYVVGECAFQAVGAESCGWTGSSNFLDRDGKGRPRTIVLSGAACHAASLVETILHECAHAFTLPTPSVLVTVQGEAGLRASGLADQYDKKLAFDERIARALAVVWEAQLPLLALRRER